MENWKKGDRALCINNKKLDTSGSGALPPLRLNAEYVIHTIRVCECGCITLDVGLNTLQDSMGVLCHCGARSSPSTGIHWCDARRFVKPKTDEATEENVEALDELLEKAIQEADQEKIDEYLDKMNKKSNQLN